MATLVTVERNPAGLEDLLFGTGTVEQIRAGVPVTVTAINAANLPFDDSRSLAQAILDLGEYNTYLQQYGSAILTLQANIQVIIEAQQALEANGGAALSELTFANSLKFDERTFAQATAEIVAVARAQIAVERDESSAVLGLEIWKLSAKLAKLQIEGLTS